MKKTKVLSYGIMLSLVLLVGCYVAISLHYTKGFPFGTWINGVYCTGKTIEEVNSYLLETVDYHEIEVQFLEGQTETLIWGEGTLQVDFSEQLQRIWMQQNPFLWVKNVIKKGQEDGYRVEPVYLVNKEILQKQFQNMQLVKAYRGKDKSVTLQYDPAIGYILHNGKCQLLDEKKALSVCLEAIEQGKDAVDLGQNLCFYDEELIGEDKKLLELSEKLDDFLDFKISYNMGDGQVELGREALSDFLCKEDGATAFVFDEEGSFTWDEEKVIKWIDDLADIYDSLGKPRTFHATCGKTVTLEKGTYGNVIDRKAEKEFLIEALQNHQSIIHEPEYSTKAWTQGLNDIGDTYIEVDIPNQTLYFYKQGQIVIETPIVTGNLLYRRDTPAGCYYIYLKQKNRTLRGPGYASHVDFWMPVYKGVGIHDALWRDEFGGEIYKTAGSHGCINIPHDVMENIYETAEVGMPVVIFY